MELPDQIRVDDQITMELIHQKHTHSLYKKVLENKEFLQDSCPWVEGFTSQKKASQFISYFSFRAEDGQCFCYVILFQNELVGCLSLSEVENGKADIGYWLDQNINGKGIVSKCIKELIPISFESLKLERIILQCQSVNVKSQNIANRFGFEIEKDVTYEMVINNQNWTIQQYSLTKQSYLEKKQKEIE